MTTIKFRRDNSANWVSINPIPALGEPCYEIDTDKLKIGNGVDHYTDLQYITDGGTATIPVASNTTLGGIKVGNNLSVTGDGTLSASSEAKTVVTPNGKIKLDDAGLHNEDNSRGIISRDTDGLEVRVGNIYESTIIDGSLIKLNSTTITDRDGNTFLTGAPTNMVTTDTDQTISSSKTFTKSITSAGVYTSNDITFDDASTSRYINNVNSITGGYRSQEGCLKLQGDTTLTGDKKLILNGRNGGITLQADSGKAIDIGGGSNTITLNPTDFAYINGNLKIRRAYSLLFPNSTGTKNTELTSNSDYLSIRTSNTRALASGYAVSITDANRNPIFQMNYDGSIINGDLATFINTANIDTTYMKWDTANKKLTVDTAAVAHLAMPSNTSVDLTLAASGATYTAPADGYFTFRVQQPNANSQFYLRVGETRMSYFYTSGTNQFTAASLPASKDEVATFVYAGSTGNYEIHSFTYCNAAAPTV